MELVEDEIYCEVHTCIHDANTDPYGYGYAQSGETPECGPDDWRKLWIGRVVDKGDDNG